jgi:hypothetical protein
MEDLKVYTATRIRDLKIGANETLHSYTMMQALTRSRGGWVQAALWGALGTFILDPLSTLHPVRLRSLELRTEASVKVCCEVWPLSLDHVTPCSIHADMVATACESTAPL